MELTDDEANLIKERRRKTEIDRTHNAALELSKTLIDLVFANLFHEESIITHGGREMSPALISTSICEAIDKHMRDIR